MVKTIVEQDAQEHWIDFQSGSRESYAWLYESYAENLYNYGFKFVPDAEFIEDTIQDIFIRIWHNKERLKVPPSVRNYLMTAFRNLLFRKLSQQKKIAADEMTEEKYSFLWELPFESAYIENESRNIHYKRLQQAIQKLTPRQKEVLFLRFYENASYEEIAEIMEISVKATYKVMARSMEGLKNNWFEYMLFPITALLLLT